MKDKHITLITYLISTLVIISCGISISNNDIYQDGAWVNAQWLGQDSVSLFIATPFLLLARYQAVRHQSWKWKLVWSGILFYFFYTYAFFMFAAQLTFLYLFHLPIFSLATIGFVVSLIDIFQPEFEISATKVWIKNVVIVYFTLMSIMISVLWLKDIFSHLTIAGYQSDMPDGEAPLIIYSLDLAIIIPLMLLAAFGYWRKKQYAYKLTAIMLVKTSTLGFALMGMSLSMFLKGISPDTFLIILWCIVGVVGMILSLFYLRQLRS